VAMRPMRSPQARARGRVGFVAFWLPTSYLQHFDREALRTPLFFSPGGARGPDVVLRIGSLLLALNGHGDGFR